MGNPSAASQMSGQTTKATALKKYAVVTGGNQGIGLEICRQLASQGVTVVLTARNEKRGLEAVEKLKNSGLSDYVTFHQLDVTDLASLSSLADYIKSQIGRIDILVNNAGINGVREGETSGAKTKKTAYELAAECLQINYYGTKQATELLLPLLDRSNSPRIVNVSSTMGMLRSIRNKWARDTLSSIESLTEEKIDQVVNVFLKDFKDGSPEGKGWPGYWSAYCVSKAVVTAYTRLLAKKHPRMTINCVCPGWVQTNLSNHSGPLKAEQGATNVVRLVMLPDDGRSGLFYDQSQVSSY